MNNQAEARGVPATGDLQLLDIEEVEALTRTTRTTIDRWCAAGTFPTKRHIGRRVVFVASEVRAWLAAQLEGQG